MDAFRRRCLRDLVRGRARQGLHGPQGTASEAFRVAHEALPSGVRGYWINAFGGMPLLCINKMLDEGLIRMLEADMIPALEAMGAPSRTRPT